MKFLLLSEICSYLLDIMFGSEIWDGSFQVVDGIPLLRVLQADHSSRCNTPRRQRREG
jgi:hypothetical protein